MFNFIHSHLYMSINIHTNLCYFKVYQAKVSRTASRVRVIDLNTQYEIMRFVPRL